MTYKFYCDCGYRRTSNGSDISDLVEVPTSPVMKNIPKPGEKGDVIPASFIKQRKRFKCPSCGRLIMAKIYETKTDKPS